MTLPAERALSQRAKRRSVVARPEEKRVGNEWLSSTSPPASSGGQTTHIEIGGLSHARQPMAQSIRPCCGLSGHWSRSPPRA